MRLLTTILAVSIFSIAKAEEVKLGDSTEAMLSSMGSPKEIRELTLGSKVFRTYIYDTATYVVDSDREIVCEVSTGDTTGYCYPCDFGPMAGTCP